MKDRARSDSSLSSCSSPDISDLEIEFGLNNNIQRRTEKSLNVAEKRGDIFEEDTEEEGDRIEEDTDKRGDKVSNIVTSD